jgi:RHS repeat-associated protein
MKTSVKRAMGFCALLATTALSSPAFAQNAPPAYNNIDANGVDLTTGQFRFSLTEGSIGSGEGALSLTRSWAGNGWLDTYQSIYLDEAVSGSTTTITLILGNSSVHFTSSGSGFTSVEGNGGTLSGSGSAYTYTDDGGTVIAFGIPGDIEDQGGASTFCNVTSQSSCKLLAGSVTKPNGHALTLDWDVHANCATSFNPDGTLDCQYGWRLGGVSNSFGYALAFTFVTNSVTFHQNPSPDWYKRSTATFSNANVGGATETVSYSYPSSTVTEVTDIGGRVWRFTTGTGGLVGIRRPGAGSDTTTISYSSGLVSSVTRDGVTTSYSRSVSGSTGTMTVTNALSQASTVVSDLTKGRPTSVTDALSRATSFTLDSSGRLTRTTMPEGDYVNYTYDGRGNITETRHVAKSGSGLSDTVSTASYDSSCTNVVKCNKPNSTTDARGNTTDYVYDSTHGGVTSVTSPAPTGGATRPQTRYSYTQVTAVTGQPVYMLTGVSACQSSSSCSGGSDEAKTTNSYETSNLLLASASSGNGSGTLSATSAMTYDPIGNLLTVDGSLSGAADTTRYRYNSARERIGTVSPDPDGGGSLKHRAERLTINSEGLVTKVERGTVNSQSDSDWAAFSALEAVETGYDSNARPTTQKLTSGSTTYALAQTSYDAVGRVECVAQRMNPSEFASLPSSACTLDTQGNYGPDRIVKTIYDAADQVTQTKTAYGASEEANEVTSTYSSNGRVATVTDGESNKTTYEYDGHDRLVKTRYPDSTKGAGTSSTTDYEQLTLDANGNVTSRRRRDGNSIGYTFDTLNRMTAKDLPGSEPDVSYTYDLLNRETGASQTGNSLSFTYDALSRKLTEVGPQGTVTSTWDIGGRRTQIDYPGSFSIDQDYLVTGEASAIREHGVTSGVGVLATYAYDDLGRRTSLTRGNGSVLSYSYDNVSRLSQLVDNLSGTTYDQTLGLTSGPGRQIIQATRSNDLYAWGGHYNVNRSYTANGRNQYTASGAITPTYDSKGNLTSAGSITYGYSSENLLTTATGSITLSYDSALRLYQAVGGVTTRMAYDGVNLVAEYDGSNALQRRYVHGPAADEPIVWYEGSGTSDRRFLHGDERGSILAVTNSSGTIIATNNYDEHGIPGASNLGRFQYTGQAWLPEISMHYYKARIYSPTLGRFLQADPVGYDAGMNLYAYVRADPINRTDPPGTFPTDIGGDDGPDSGLDPTRFVDERKVNCRINPGQCDKPNEFCVVIISNIGSDPAQLAIDIGLGLVGNSIGDASGKFAEAYMRQTGKVIGAEVGTGARIGARAGRVGGAVGLIAGAALGYYYRKEIQNAIKFACTF